MVPEIAQVRGSRRRLLPAVRDVAGGFLLRWSGVMVGAVLVACSVAFWHRYDLSTLDALALVVPGVATVGGWLLVLRSGVAVEEYPLVLRFALGGGAVLGGFVLGVLVVQDAALAGVGTLVLFMTSTGTVAGLLVGANRAQGLRARRQAEALRVERTRMDFLNHLLRHNVLNKVAIIKGNAALAGEAGALEDDHLETILEQSDDVVALVDNIRVLMSAAGPDPDLRPVDLSRELRKEVASVRHAHERVEIHVDVADDLTVPADDLLRYVFENLLHNAVEHHDTGTPTVEVEARETDGEVVVRVADDGPGIPERRKALLFEPEMHGDHGVGLYLVRTLVEQYGGALDLADNEPHGTVVTVRFPAVD